MNTDYGRLHKLFPPPLKPVVVTWCPSGGACTSKECGSTERCDFGYPLVIDKHTKRILGSVMEDGHVIINPLRKRFRQFLKKWRAIHTVPEMRTGKFSKAHSDRRRRSGPRRDTAGRNESRVARGSRRQEFRRTSRRYSQQDSKHSQSRPRKDQDR